MLLEKLKKIPLNLLFGVAVLIGLFSGYVQVPAIDATAQTVSQIFINLLKLVSLPIIFLSIVSTASSMESMSEVKNLGKKVTKYTFLTTIIAAAIALVLYIAIDPVQGHIMADRVDLPTDGQASYVTYLINVIPSNIIQPFIENNVIGVLLIALLLSLAILSLPKDKREVLHTFFSGLYHAIMKITGWIITLMPLAIWAFVTLFLKDLREGLEVRTLALYLLVVILANLVQGLLVLPALLKMKGISPFKTLKGMFPALSVAFFAKSSSAALPMAMKCAEENVGVSRRVAGFSFPLCTTINMNGCAAFILTTVLFVSMSHGFTYSYPEMVVWILISTIAAIGNAGVPMGCYFISSAFLVAMNVPLNILGIILPFYTFIDMLETAINVWSDSCVTTIVDKELAEEEAALSPQEALLEPDLPSA